MAELVKESGTDILMHKNTRCVVCISLLQLNYVLNREINFTVSFLDQADQLNPRNIKKKTCLRFNKNKNVCH